MHVSPRLFLLFIPVGLLTLALFLTIRSLRRRSLARDPSVQRSRQARPAGRPLAAICGVLWLTIGLGPAALLVRCLPHVTLDDLSNAAGAALLGVPASLVLLSYALRGEAPGP